MENDPPAAPDSAPPAGSPAADRPLRGERPRRPRSRRPEGAPTPGDAPPSDWSPRPRTEGGEENPHPARRSESRGGGGDGDRPPRREPRAGGGGSSGPDGTRPPRDRGGRSGGGSRDRSGGGPNRRESSRSSGGEQKTPVPETAPAGHTDSSRDAGKNAPGGEDAERVHLAGPLLTAVSRSFAISIKLLPEPLRGPISLGYLFARALDTIADSPAAPAPERLGHLRAVLDMLKYGVDPAALRTLERALAPRQAHAGERELLGKLPALFLWMESLPAADRWDLQRTLARIGYGQELDLRRFGGAEGDSGSGGSDPKALETAEETHDYAYLVAGSAGEFWTRLCERHLAGYAKLPAAEMLGLGRRLGQGLQLVNILRDLPRDLAAGRCYLPAEDLAAHGLATTDLLRTPERARPLLAKWRAAAVEHLDAGWRYVQAVQPSKLRYAVALPALLAVRTLALLAKTSPLETPEPVKVPRMAVRQLMLTSAAASILAPRLLDRLYKGPRKTALEG